MAEVNLEIDVTEGGIDRFKASGPVEEVKALFTEWVQRQAQLKDEAQKFLEAARGAGMGAGTASPREQAPAGNKNSDKGPLPFKPRS